VFWLQATTFQCDPVSRAWDPLNARCTCINTLLMGVAGNALNLLTDLILLLPPVSVVLQLLHERGKEESACELKTLLLLTVSRQGSHLIFFPNSFAFPSPSNNPFP
jgi:hypothetical protein